jgi:hypothetical protein
VSDDIFEAFKVNSEAPEPEKGDALMFVAEMGVPVKGPDNIPPVKVKNNDNV